MHTYTCSWGTSFLREILWVESLKDALIPMIWCRTYCILGIYKPFSLPAVAWSLSSVKVALSHLHWQREKVLRSDTPLHLKLGSTLMEVVGGAFHLQEDHLFNRTRMVKALLSQQKRGAVSSSRTAMEEDGFMHACHATACPGGVVDTDSSYLPSCLDNCWLYYNLLVVLQSFSLSFFPLFVP